MYKEKQFRIRSTEDVIADLERARGFASSIKRIFFADGDAFIRKSEEQLKISAAVKRIFPECERVSMYASPKSVLIKTDDELKALHDAGITINTVDPDYVIVGETNNYNYDSICRAVHHVFNGAKLIGTNTDITAPLENGIVPACRALISPIEMATGKSAYYVGKPNPLMMRTGLKMLGVHSQDAAIIGDRMDTDIIAGIESGLDTVLVLTGVTSHETMQQYPYRPRLVLENVGEIPRP